MQNIIVLKKTEIITFQDIWMTKFVQRFIKVMNRFLEKCVTNGQDWVYMTHFIAVT